MKHRQSITKLSKFLAYMLGRHPDEFGLLPDSDGYVKLKDLMKALGEEPGWRHIRLGHIREVIYTTRTPSVEMEKKRIRASDRSQLMSPESPNTFPKRLYYPVRQRAYPVVLEKGLDAQHLGKRIIMSVDIDFAKRLGRRIDAAPVILTVNAEIARKKGAALWRFGKQLFLSDHLPIGSFSGPPLPKDRPDQKRETKPEPAHEQKTPGSFLLDLSEPAQTKSRLPKGKHKRKNEWKQARKRKSRDSGFP